MCIIIYKPAGKALQPSIVARCAIKNPDGFGIVYPSGDALQVKKTMQASTWEQWATDERLTEKPAILHARIATSGAVNTKTCHPFKVADRQPRVSPRHYETETGYKTRRPVVAHNGILQTFEPWSKRAIESDSIIFAETFLEPLSTLTSLHSDTAREIIEAVLDGSRIAIMTADGQTSLFGYGWKKSEGIYYSNDGYKPVKGYGYGYGYGGDAWSNYYFSDGWKTEGNDDLILEIN